MLVIGSLKYGKKLGFELRRVLAMQEFHTNAQ